LVILHLHRKLPIAEFFKIINEKPLACNLLEVYCKEQNLGLLKDFYYQADYKSETAAILTNESYAESVFKKKKKNFFIIFFIIINIFL